MSLADDISNDSSYQFIIFTNYSYFYFYLEQVVFHASVFFYYILYKIAELFCFVFFRAKYL